MSIWSWPPDSPFAKGIILPDGTRLPFGAIADGQLLKRVGNEIVGTTLVLNGAILQDQFLVQLTTAFSTADTTSPGTVAISQVVNIPANSWIVVLGTFCANMTGTTGTPRAELLSDGVLLANARSSSGTIATIGNPQAGSIQFAGAPAAFGGTGNRTIGLAFYTAGTGNVSIDPTTSVAQQAALQILVFVDA